MQNIWKINFYEFFLFKKQNQKYQLFMVLNNWSV